jgi:hypothetical protein
VALLEVSLHMPLVKRKITWLSQLGRRSSILKAFPQLALVLRYTSTYPTDRRRAKAHCSPIMNREFCLVAGLDSLRRMTMALICSRLRGKQQPPTPRIDQELIPPSAFCDYRLYLFVIIYSGLSLSLAFFFPSSFLLSLATLATKLSIQTL